MELRVGFQNQVAGLNRLQTPNRNLESNKDTQVIQQEQITRHDAQSSLVVNDVTRQGVVKQRQSHRGRNDLGTVA